MPETLGHVRVEVPIHLVPPEANAVAGEVKCGVMLQLADWPYVPKWVFEMAPFATGCFCSRLQGHPATEPHVSHHPDVEFATVWGGE